MDEDFSLKSKEFKEDSNSSKKKLYFTYLSDIHMNHGNTISSKSILSEDLPNQLTQ